MVANMYFIKLAMLSKFLLLWLLLNFNIYNWILTCL